MKLQDRETCIALLVGAKYGISQVVNSKLNIVTLLAEFANISRLELTKESDKVSMVKIYLQDIKVNIFHINFDALLCQEHFSSSCFPSSIQGAHCAAGIQQCQRSGLSHQWLL